MFIKSLTLKGLVPFPDEVHTVFPDDRPIIAVCGENGAGKTTFLDAVPMALYGSTPNRKAFYECFRGKDGIIDLVFDYLGREIRVKRLVNANSRSQKGYLYIDGKPVTEGNVTELQSTLLRYFPVQMSLFLATAFHPQSGKGQAVDMNDGDKRALLEDVLDLNMFDEPYELAQTELKRCQIDYDAEVKLKDALGEPVDVKSLEEAAEACRVQVYSIGVALDEVPAKKQTLIERQAVVKANGQQQVEILRQRDNLRKQLAEGRANLENLNARLAANRDQLIARKDEIMAAWTEADAIKPQLDGIERQRDAATAAAAEQELAFRERLDAATTKLTQARQAKDDAVKAQQQALQAKAVLEQQIAGLERAIAQAQGQTSVLNEVPCAGTEMNDTCALLKGARDMKEKQHADSLQLETLKQQLAATVIDDGPIRQAIQAIEAFEAEHTRVSSEDPSRALQTELARLKTAAQPLLQRLQELEPLTKLVPHLEHAEEKAAGYEAEIARLTPAIESDAAALETLEQQAKDCEDVEATLAAISQELAVLDETTRTMSADKDAKTQELATLQAKITAANEQAAKRLEVEQRIGALGKRMETLRYLVEGLGPKGARALKIDAAVPEIAAIINELLAECYDTRFTVSIETQKELASKDELRECLSFCVVDESTGEKSNVDTKSGGEQALIKEVISLGLAVYKGQTSGVKLETLFRDECSAPLSEANTERYIQMLRRAMDLGGFKQAFIVTHKKSAQDLVDAKIIINNGKTLMEVA